MWEPVETDKYASRVRRLARRHKAATIAVHDNLDTYLEALRDGARPDQLRPRSKFIHPEPGGIIAIDQSGTPRKLAELRLYVYPDEATEKVYLITIGKKDEQKRQDLPDCRAFLKKMRRDKSDG